MFKELTAQITLFDNDPEYMRPKYMVWFIGDRLPGLYSQHDVDAFKESDPGGWKFKFRPVEDQPGIPAYAMAIE